MSFTDEEKKKMKELDEKKTEEFYRGFAIEAKENSRIIKARDLGVRIVTHAEMNLRKKRGLPCENYRVLYNVLRGRKQT